MRSELSGVGLGRLLGARVLLVVLAVAIFIAWLGLGGRWLGRGGSEPDREQAQLVNPLPRWREYLAPRPTPTSSPVSGQTIKVVSEESQVIEMVKKSSPAVVSIIASAEVPKIEQCLRRGGPMFPDLPTEFQQFFDFDVPGFCEAGKEKRRVGAGTGFLVSRDGFILTNRHVVADEKAEYTVVLNDAKHFGKKVKARVLARDPENDIAVLRIDVGDDLPYLTFGNSDKLQVGQTAIAIGYSLGEFDNTVSKGVVSGLARSIAAGGGSQGLEQLRGLTQTDAAINPGNSGGPLLNIAGEVIGMNVAMANAQSIGFAIPGNLARAAWLQVKDTGLIKAPERSFLGVRYIPITDEVRSANQLPYDYGMLVTRGERQEDLAVVPGSPADKAGLVENDIILEVDGQALNERLLLSDVLSNRRPGDPVTLKIYHRGEVKTVRVTLEKR